MKKKPHITIWIVIAVLMLSQMMNTHLIYENRKLVQKYHLESLERDQQILQSKNQTIQSFRNLIDSMLKELIGEK